MYFSSHQHAAGFFSLSTLSLSLSSIGMSVVGMMLSTAHAKTVTLPETVITASLNTTSLTDIVGDVLVITQDEIDTHLGQSALEVLESQPSIIIQRSGGVGTVSGVSLRGNKNQHTLVLIDGIRYGSVSVGGSALGLIPASQVERIEVLYGSSATSLYGSDAIGGVIQLFTKQSDYNQKRASFTFGGGSLGSYIANSQLGYGADSFRVGLGASYEETDGVNTLNRTDPNNPYDNFESDKDGFKNKAANINLGAKLGRNTELSLSGMYSKSKTDFDAADPSGKTHSNQENGASSITLSSQFGKAKVNFSYGASLDDVKSPTYASRFKTMQTQSKLLISYGLGFGRLNAGAEMLNQHLDTTSALVKDKRDTLSGLLGYQLVSDKLYAQASMRIDDTKDKDSKNTYSLGLAHSPTQGVRLGGTYATGFRLPTFNDLYYPFEDYGSYSYQGNSELKPETSKNIEAFVELSGAQFLTRLTAFQNKVDELIAFSTLPSGTGSMINVDKATIQGISLKSKWHTNALFAGFHYDYLNAKDTHTDKYLTYRAMHSGGVHAGVKSNDYQIKAEVVRTGMRYSDAANTDELDGYTLVNISGDMRLSPAIEVGVTVNNLLKEDYELNKNYSTLGTNAMATVTLHTP